MPTYEADLTRGTLHHLDAPHTKYMSICLCSINGKYTVLRTFTNKYRHVMKLWKRNLLHASDSYPEIVVYYAAAYINTPDAEWIAQSDKSRDTVIDHHFHGADILLEFNNLTDQPIVKDYRYG